MRQTRGSLLYAYVCIIYILYIFVLISSPNSLRTIFGNLILTLPITLILLFNNGLSSLEVHSCVQLCICVYVCVCAWLCVCVSRVLSVSMAVCVCVCVFNKKLGRC